MDFGFSMLREQIHYKFWFKVVLCAAVLARCAAELRADDDRIDLPLPEPSANAAVYYQRGLLFLYAIDPAKRELLTKPIWEILEGLTQPDQLAATNDLMIESRHAIRAALAGARRGIADFGIEPRNYVASTLLPHADGMIDLGKLVLLYGAQLETEGDWDRSAEVYLHVLHMGRQMAHQTTLVEAFTGTEILESGYYTLALWGVRCPERALVNQASLMLNVLSSEMIDPAQTMSYEFRYSKLRLAQLQDEFPDGNWAEMILEASGATVPNSDQSEMREVAIQAAVKNGVPESVFRSKQAFDAHIEKVRSLELTMAQDVAAAMTLPTVPAIERSQQIYDRFAAELRELGDSAILHPGQIAGHFAIHNAELVLAKVVLALAASKDEQGFPASLDDIAVRFGGQVPHSPYDNSALVYKVSEGRKGFELTVGKVSVGDIELPQIDFRFAPDDDAR